MKKDKILNFVSWPALFKSYFKKVANGSDSVMFLSQGVEVFFPDKTKRIGLMESNAPTYESTYSFVYQKKESTSKMSAKELVDNIFDTVRTKIDKLPKNTKFRLLN